MQRLPRRLLDLRRGQITGVLHQPQHRELASLRRLRVEQRVVAAGILHQPGEQRTFGGAQLGSRFRKENLRSSLYSERKIAVVGLVQIERQQLIFVVVALKLESQVRLAQFAKIACLIALIVIHEQVARQLLRQGAGAGGDAAAAEILPGGARNRQRIDAGVIEKAAVLGGNGRLHARGGDAAQVEVVLLAGVGVEHLVEQLAIAVENLRGWARGAQFHRRHRRQVGEQPVIHPIGKKRNKGQADHCQTPGVLPLPHKPFHRAILHLS